MSRKLAIKGHPTRGKEVIELLEMLGGNRVKDCPVFDSIIYFINEKGQIVGKCAFDFPYGNYQVFTLEEFLEKYPFKVGDKVLIPEYESEVRICKMRWDSLCSYVDYMVYRNDAQEWYTAEELLNYNDGFYDAETKENDMGKTGYTLNELIDFLPLTSDTVMIAVKEGFEIIEEQGKFFLKRKKPTYPTTYEECCNVNVWKWCKYLWKVYNKGK